MAAAVPCRIRQAISSPGSCKYPPCSAGLPPSPIQSPHGGAEPFNAQHLADLERSAIDYYCRLGLTIWYVGSTIQSCDNVPVEPVVPIPESYQSSSHRRYSSIPPRPTVTHVTPQCCKERVGRCIQHTHRRRREEGIVWSLGFFQVGLEYPVYIARFPPCYSSP